MALPHLHSGQVADVTAFGDLLSQQTTVALFKAKHLEVIRLVLQSRQTLPEHKVSGEVTIYCIEGKLEISLPSGSVDLLPGQLMFLNSNLPHGVIALQPSSALVTISLPNGDR